MEPGQKVYYCPCTAQLADEIKEVTYKGPAKRSAYQSTISYQGWLQPTRTSNLFRTKKEALAELANRLQAARDEVLRLYDLED